jgi:ABC-type multidrug transport system fused ATPase/permease subunit
MKEKTIEEMFAHYQPDLGDSGEYMAHLTKKLEAAEYAKQYKAEQTRRYRRMMVLVFVAGVLTGGILMLITLMHPTWLVPDFSAPTLSTSLTTVFPKVCLLLAICFISLGTTGLVGSVVLNRRR